MPIQPEGAGALGGAVEERFVTGVEAHHRAADALPQWAKRTEVGDTMVMRVGPAGGRGVPEVSRFYGLVIALFYNDHQPPHFHAVYGEFEAVFAIDTLEVLDGDLPRRAMALVLEWAVDHRQELHADWERARAKKPLAPIPPLP